MNDRECTTACTIPVSFFQNVKCRVPECAETLTWHEFKQLLQHYAQIEYHAKHEAPLLSPTIFKGSRAKENATEAGVVVIDADDGLSFDEALAALQARGLAAVLYTTARNRVGDRFRIVVPLAARVDPETYKRVLIAIKPMLGWTSPRLDVLAISPVAVNAASKEWLASTTSVRTLLVLGPVAPSQMPTMRKDVPARVITEPASIPLGSDLRLDLLRGRGRHHRLVHSRLHRGPPSLR